MKKYQLKTEYKASVTRMMQIFGAKTLMKAMTA
jgi:hypothetical protein